MRSPFFRFRVNSDTFTVREDEERVMLLLERTLGDDDAAVAQVDPRWDETQKIVLEATCRGRLFPELVGPLGQRKGQDAVPTEGDDPLQEARHRLPDNTRIVVTDGILWEAEASTPINPIDLLLCAVRLTVEIIHEEAERKLVSLVGPGSAALLYSEESRLWFLPGTLAAVPSSGDDVESPPVYVQTVLASVLLKILPGANVSYSTHLTNHASWKLLRSDLEQFLASSSSRTEQLKSYLIAALERFNQPLTPISATRATCSCGAAIGIPGTKCAACGRTWKVLREYVMISESWVYHPRMGFKRHWCVRLPDSTKRPSLKELNRSLKEVGQTRVIDLELANKTHGDGKVDKVLFLICSDKPGGDAAAPADLTEMVVKIAVPSTTVRPPKFNRPVLDNVRVFSEDGGGVRCMWKSIAGANSKIYVWWSDTPLANESWEALARSAEHSACLDGTSRDYSIRVDKPQTVFAAVGVEQNGQHQAFQVCDESIRALPRRDDSEAEPARPMPPASAAVETLPAVPCGCGAEIPVNRAFCPKCGAGRARATSNTTASSGAHAAEQVTADAEPLWAKYELVRTLETSGDASRNVFRFEDTEIEGIDAPRVSPLKALAEAVNLAAGEWPSALPRVVETIYSANRTRFIISARPAGALSWVDLCQQQEFERQMEVLPILLRGAIASLEFLHKHGFAYGTFYPEHLYVDPQQGPFLAWPLTPLELNAPLGKVNAPMGYVCPEFGREDQVVQPSWDLYSLGISVLWTMKRELPPESLSAEGWAVPNLRIYLPELAAGWGGFFGRLLAKKPPERFTTAVEAIQALDRLMTPSSPPASLEVAAAQHVGVTKFTMNPKNQDRCFYGGIGRRIDSTARTAYPEYAPGECFSTSVETLPLPLVAAIADGVSTVDSGEFAATSIFETLAEFAEQGLDSTKPPGLLLVDLFERANMRLGNDIEQAVAADPALENWLRPGMVPSSTLAALLFSSPKAAVANVGDSRAYLLRDGALEQLTVDGDQLTEYLSSGMDLPESIARDDAKEIVSWIGRFEREDGRAVASRALNLVECGGFWRFEFEPRIGDVYCVCSDGISDFVDGGLIDLKAALLSGNADEACRRLVAEANENGGLDNISVVVVHARGDSTCVEPYYLNDDRKE